jgi:uncharacterized membrane protein YoaK (UPF0700 family)
MKHIVITMSFFTLVIAANTASAQQVVDSPVKQKVIATRGNFASAIDDVDRYLVNQQEEEAFKAFNVALDILGQNITMLKGNIKSASQDGERMMYTKKFNAQSKSYGKLKELSLHLLQNRNLVNLEFKDALKNM